MPSFLEFFAGGGMARAGLGTAWSCLFANDFDFKKASAYRINWGGQGLHVADIKRVVADEIPSADLAWASFPCQDLSLAGSGAGLRGDRSGTFYHFWDIIKVMAFRGRAPKIVALENVVGTLTSHKGHDFASICDVLARNGYRFGALVIDAALFLPQSRSRLFFVGVHERIEIPNSLLSPEPLSPFHTRGLRKALSGISADAEKRLLWWNLPIPPRSNIVFADLVEDCPDSVEWHSLEETHQLLKMMSPVNAAKVDAARRSGRRMVGAVYKRTRNEVEGKIQRAEIRFDDISGCLRTPVGGSSRQVIVVVDGDIIRSRLISTRETARLMGLPDDYKLPKRYNEAYHLTGDGVAVPVVRHLAHHIFEPVLQGLSASGPRVENSVCNFAAKLSG